MYGPQSRDSMVSIVLGLYIQKIVTKMFRDTCIKPDEMSSSFDNFQSFEGKC